MPQNPPAEGDDKGRDRLFALRTCLNDLQAAMQGGHWELLEQLSPRLAHTLQQLQVTPTLDGGSSTDTEEFRQLLAQSNNLLIQAKARQQQIAPLLGAWRPKAEVDNTPPP